MPVTTSKVLVNNEWTQMASGDCTLGSLNTTEVFNLYVGDTAPTEDSAYGELRLTELTTLAWQAPVWLRLGKMTMIQAEYVTVITEIAAE